MKSKIILIMLALLNLAICYEKTSNYTKILEAL